MSMKEKIEDLHKRINEKEKELYELTQELKSCYYRYSIDGINLSDLECYLKDTPEQTKFQLKNEILNKIVKYGIKSYQKVEQRGTIGTLMLKIEKDKITYDDFYNLMKFIEDHLIF